MPVRALNERSWIPPDRGACSAGAYFRSCPASTGSATPVMYLPDSPHRYSIALLMSRASTSGTGSRFCICGREVCMFVGVSLRMRVDDHLGSHSGGVDGIDSDILLGECGRVVPHQPNYTVLGCCISRRAVVSGAEASGDGFQTPTELVITMAPPAGLFSNAGKAASIVK
jgi:hypothetical protein